MRAALMDDQGLAMDREAVAIQVQPVPTAAAVGSCIALPCNCLCGWLMVEPKSVKVALHLGVVTGIYDTPGCFKVPFCGLEERNVSVAKQTLDLPNAKIVDGNGSPIMVSAIINYQVTDPMKAIFEVTNYREYLTINASAIVKAVVGKHNYNDLKNEPEKINKELNDALQPTMRIAGLNVLSISLNELNYAPEIAASMLKKQAAGALIEARKLIVQGAVAITSDAIVQLESQGTIYRTL